MGRIRIQGLVRTATLVRQELAGTISPQRIESLKAEVRDCIRTVDEILAEHHERIDGLPAPSQKAYAFLAGIDFQSVELSRSVGDERRDDSSIRLSGLRRFVEHLLDRLARANPRDRAVIYGQICESSRNIEAELARDATPPQRLTEESRSFRGWMAYFSDQENFDAYVSALRLARPAFEQVAKGLERVHLPMLIHFRPMKKLCRLRRFSNATRVSLPTPMICLDGGDFAALARMALVGGKEKQRIVEKTCSKAYQSIQAQLEALGGVVERTSGMAHDLADSFGRVNATYFDGRMVRPRLTWSRGLTHRKFGHYDAVHDTVMVSASLDDAKIPEYVVDFLVYHELLHKKLGAHWNNGRRHAHTPEFRHEERKFKRFAEAEAVLNKLAGVCHDHEK